MVVVISDLHFIDQRAFPDLQADMVSVNWDK